MNFIGRKLKMSNEKRQFYYDIKSKWFLKVVQSDDEDLPILYETTHDLYTRDDERHILFPNAIFFWPKQVAILFPRTSVDLFTYTKHHTMSESDVAFTIKCLLRALTYLHSKEIIHCDIKRENTVVCLTSRTLKLIDFEYATQNSPISNMRTESEYGTIFAPEMKRRKWNNSVDFYCVGYLFRELCDVSSSHRKTDRRRILRDILRQKFSHIYTSMTQKIPSERIGFVKSVGFVSDPIIEAIDACEGLKGGAKSKYNEYSDEFIETISKYSEETYAELITIDLVQ